MKKYVLMLFFITVFFTFTLSETSKAQSSITDIPYPTYSYGLEGQLVSTATAYEGTFILNPGFNNPQDIYIDSQDHVYVADTGNKRIYEYNPTTKESMDIGSDVLESPMGVFVDNDFNIYVADSKAKAIFVFDKTGKLLNKFGRPTEPLFGDNAPYTPVKILVDARKNMYVVSQGGFNGIIQMDAEGHFLGYYGVNKVSINWKLQLKRLLMSKAQREKNSLTPQPITNIAIDSKGLIYTITRNENTTPLKKLNIEGNNILTGYGMLDPNFQDVTVDQDGLIYTVSNQPTLGATVMGPPVIDVYDSQGNLLFTFGDINQGSLKIGEFDNPSGIATDKNGDIWILDSSAGNIQVFTKTEFASMVITAINDYNNGEYEQSEALFKQVIRQNAMFGLAHSNLGKIYEKQGKYKLALESYRIANDKQGYSDMYWQLRDEWLANNMLTAIGVIIGLLIALKIYNKQKHKIKAYQKFKEKMTTWKQKTIFKELGYLKRILKDPNYVAYDIKFRQSIRIRTAVMLYIFFIFLNIICNYYIKGYLFRSNTSDVVLTFEILKWFLPLFLFGIANHLMNSLQSGEAFFRDLFIGIIYALSPILLFKLPLDIISNVLTYNEAFIYHLAYYIIYGWSIVNLIYLIKELNNYKFFQLIMNLILTILTMLILIIIYLVINVLITQFLTFILGILREVLF